MITVEKKYAHEIEPHPEEGEAVPLDRLVRYHYAQAQAWHLAFAEAISGDIGTAEFDFPLSRYLGHSHLAFLHDALLQGLSGQEAADWASVRHHSESAELVWERGVAYGLNPDAIRPYETKRKGAVSA
jgi:hypothetical protein